jgi:hypothetical protein
VGERGDSKVKNKDEVEYEEKDLLQEDTKISPLNFASALEDLTIDLPI